MNKNTSKQLLWLQPVTLCSEAGFPFKYITNFLPNFSEIHYCYANIIGVSSLRQVVGCATFSSQVSFTTAEEDGATSLNQLRSHPLFTKFVSIALIHNYPFVDTPTFPPPWSIKTLLPYFRFFSNFLCFHSGNKSKMCIKTGWWKPS